MPLVFITGFGRGEPPEGRGEGEAFSRGGDFARPKAEDGGGGSPREGIFPNFITCDELIHSLGIFSALKIL